MVVCVGKLYVVVMKHVGILEYGLEYFWINIQFCMFQEQAYTDKY